MITLPELNEADLPAIRAVCSKYLIEAALPNSERVLDLVSEAVMAALRSQSRNVRYSELKNVPGCEDLDGCVFLKSSGAYTNIAILAGGRLKVPEVISQEMSTQRPDAFLNVPGLLRERIDNAREHQRETGASTLFKRVAPRDQQTHQAFYKHLEAARVRNPDLHDALSAIMGSHFGGIYSLLHLEKLEDITDAKAVMVAEPVLKRLDERLRSELIAEGAAEAHVAKTLSDEWLLDPTVCSLVTWVLQRPLDAAEMRSRLAFWHDAPFYALGCAESEWGEIDGNPVPFAGKDSRTIARALFPELPDNWLKAYAGLDSHSITTRDWAFLMDPHPDILEYPARYMFSQSPRQAGEGARAVVDVHHYLTGAIEALERPVRPGTEDAAELASEMQRKAVTSILLRAKSLFSAAGGSNRDVGAGLADLRDVAIDFMNRIGRPALRRAFPDSGEDFNARADALLFSELLAPLKWEEIANMSIRWHERVATLTDDLKTSMLHIPEWEPIAHELTIVGADQQAYTATAVTTSGDLITLGDDQLHCVGAFGPKCAFERCHIVVFRNQRDQVVATIELELGPDGAITLVQARGKSNVELEEIYASLVQDYLARLHDEKLVDVSALDAALSVRRKLNPGQLDNPAMLLAGYNYNDDRIISDTFRVYKRVLPAFLPYEDIGAMLKAVAGNAALQALDKAFKQDAELKP